MVDGEEWYFGRKSTQIARKTREAKKRATVCDAEQRWAAVLLRLSRTTPVPQYIGNLFHTFTVRLFLQKSLHKMWWEPVYWSSYEAPKNPGVSVVPVIAYCAISWRYFWAQNALAPQLASFYSMPPFVPIWSDGADPRCS